jgi:DNA-binding XRE family transcriptional regulator
MADKTSWTKPLACMTYGDSIVRGTREAGQTRAGLGGRRVSSPSPRRLGTVIRELRKRRGLTQAELAKKAGVTQGYIAKLEPSNRPGQRKTTRKANPSLPTLRKLARALGVPVRELLE